MTTTQTTTHHGDTGRGYTAEELDSLMGMTLDQLENVLVGIEVGLDATPGDMDLITQAAQVRDEMGAR